MKRRSGSIPETLMSVCSAGASRGLQVFSANGQRGKSGCSLLIFAALLAVSTQAAIARQAPSARADGACRAIAAWVDTASSAAKIRREQPDLPRCPFAEKTCNPREAPALQTDMSVSGILPDRLFIFSYLQPSLGS